MEASEDKAKAEFYYAALVTSTGKASERPEVVRARRFLAGAESAAR